MAHPELLPVAGANRQRASLRLREDWLRRQDSNLGSWIQSPLPYRLATPE